MMNDSADCCGDDSSLATDDLTDCLGKSRTGSSIGSVDQREKLLEAMKMNFLGSEHDFISDELIGKYADDDNSFDESLLLSEQRSVKDELDGDQGIPDMKLSDDELSFMNELNTDDPEGNKLQVNTEVSDIPLKEGNLTTKSGEGDKQNVSEKCGIIKDTIATVCNDVLKQRENNPKTSESCDVTLKEKSLTETSVEDRVSEKEDIKGSLPCGSTKEVVVKGSCGNTLSGRTLKVNAKLKDPVVDKFSSKKTYDEKNCSSDDKEEEYFLTEKSSVTSSLCSEVEKTTFSVCESKVKQLSNVATKEDKLTFSKCEGGSLFGAEEKSNVVNDDSVKANERLGGKQGGAEEKNGVVNDDSVKANERVGDKVGGAEEKIRVVSDKPVTDKGGKKIQLVVSNDPEREHISNVTPEKDKSLADNQSVKDPVNDKKETSHSRTNEESKDASVANESEEQPHDSNKHDLEVHHKSKDNEVEGKGTSDGENNCKEKGTPDGKNIHVEKESSVEEKGSSVEENSFEGKESSVEENSFEKKGASVEENSHKGNNGASVEENSHEGKGAPVEENSHKEKGASVGENSQPREICEVNNENYQLKYSGQVTRISDEILNEGNDSKKKSCIEGESDHLEGQVDQSLRENCQLAEMKGKLARENDQLEEKKDQLARENDQFEEEKDWLTKENDQLGEKKDQLASGNDKLEEKKDQLASANDELEGKQNQEARGNDNVKSKEDQVLTEKDKVMEEEEEDQVVKQEGHLSGESSQSAEDNLLKEKIDQKSDESSQSASEKDQTADDNRIETKVMDELLTEGNQSGKVAGEGSQLLGVKQHILKETTQIEVDKDHTSDKNPAFGGKSRMLEEGKEKLLRESDVGESQIEAKDQPKEDLGQKVQNVTPLLKVRTETESSQAQAMCQDIVKENEFKEQEGGQSCNETAVSEQVSIPVASPKLDEYQDQLTSSSTDQSLVSSSETETLLKSVIGEEKECMGSIVNLVRRQLTPEEVQFVKMGQIQPCSVMLKRMKSKLIRSYVTGRIKTNTRGEVVKRFFIPLSMKLRIVKDLDRGLPASEIASAYGISRSSVGRIRNKITERKRKALMLGRKPSNELSGNSKRALTFSTRVKIMGKLERGVSIEALSHEYGINKSTLKTLRSLKNKKLKERQNSLENIGGREMPECPVKVERNVQADLEPDLNKRLHKTFKKPKCFLSVLMILILHNTESRSLTYSIIKKLLCYLFPWFYKEWRTTKWRKNLSTATVKRAKNFFLKTQVKAKGDRFILSLNPEEEANWKKYIRDGTQHLRIEAEVVMRRPELLESLLLGIVRLDNWNITEEDLKIGFCEDEDETSHSADGSLDTYTDGNESSLEKRQEIVCNPLRAECSQPLLNRDNPSQTEAMKRKCESPSEQPCKLPKPHKTQNVTSPSVNQGSNIGNRSGMGQDICDNNVNNRLVDLLMGKENKLSNVTDRRENSKEKKSSPVHKNLAKGSSYSRFSVKDSDHSVKKEARTPSPIMVDTLLSMPSTEQVLAVGSERNSLSIIGLPSTSAVPEVEGRPVASSAFPKMEEQNAETSSSNDKQFTSESEEENMPRIVSVEGAYHMWTPGDQNPSETLDSDKGTPSKGKKEYDKTFGKSLLSMVKKKRKSQSKECSPASSSSKVDQRIPINFDPGMSHFSAPQSIPGMFPSKSMSIQSSLSSSYSMPTMSPIIPSHIPQQQRDPGESQFPPPPGTSPVSQSLPVHQFAVPMGPPPSSFVAGQPSQMECGVLPHGLNASVGRERAHFRSNGPIVNYDINRPLSSWTPTPYQMSQKSHSNQDIDEHSSVPKISNCIETWQKVFPWMYYIENERAFACHICEWASSDRKDFEVFRLQTPKDVYLVAGQLRYHKETLSHRTVAYKKERICQLLNFVYPILKGHLQEISGVEDIIKTVSDLAGGTFPGPQESPQKEYFMTYMIKHIAECIEEKLLKSLAESPYFSVITVKDKDYAIIRWLNNKGESEEHFFCSQIGYPGENMSCLTYLKRKNVNMTKLISYSILSNMIASNIENVVMLQVPVRYPPLAVCLNWLEKASFLKSLFQQLTVLTKLCKTSYYKFAAFPEAAELKNLSEPYSHSCIVNERIINFFFGNIKVLRKIAEDIYKTSGNMEAYGFSALELQECDSLMRCSALFPKLHSIMSSKHADSQSLCALLREFRNKICQRLSEIKQKTSSEYIVMSLVDIFLSHVMLTLLSPGKEITDMFSKKLRHLTTADVEKIFPNLMSEYEGSSTHCLEKLHSLRVHLAKSRDCSLLQLLAILVSRPDLGQQFPELYRLYQKITVLPFLHAHVEQCMFNVAAAEVFLTSKVERRLMLPVTLILLEGSPVDQIDKDHIIASWSKKWKISNLHKNL